MPLKFYYETYFEWIINKYVKFLLITRYLMFFDNLIKIHNLTANNIFNKKNYNN